MALPTEDQQLSPNEVVAQALTFHGEWRRTLLDAIASGRSDLDPAHVADSATCSFGEWLEHHVPWRLRRTWDYANVRKLHDEFHAAAGAALSIAITEGRDRATRTLMPGSELEVATQRLMVSLREWQMWISSQAAGKGH